MNKTLVAALIFSFALLPWVLAVSRAESGRNAEAAGYRFIVPGGWHGIDQGDSVTFLPPDDPERGIILLMPVVLPIGDLEKQALSAMKSYAMGMVNTPPQISKPLHDKLENGAEYVSAYSNFTTEKFGDVFLAVFACEQNGAVGTMLFFAQKQEVQLLLPDAIHLFANLDLTDKAKELAAARARGGNSGKSQ